MLLLPLILWSLLLPTFRLLHAQRIGRLGLLGPSIFDDVVLLVLAFSSFPFHPADNRKRGLHARLELALLHAEPYPLRRQAQRFQDHDGSLDVDDRHSGHRPRPCSERIRLLIHLLLESLLRPFPLPGIVVGLVCVVLRAVVQWQRFGRSEDVVLFVSHRVRIRAQEGQ